MCNFSFMYIYFLTIFNSFTFLTVCVKQKQIVVPFKTARNKCLILKRFWAEYHFKLFRASLAPWQHKHTVCGHYDSLVKPNLLQTCKHQPFKGIVCLFGETALFAFLLGVSWEDWCHSHICPLLYMRRCSLTLPITLQLYFVRACIQPNLTHRYESGTELLIKFTEKKADKIFPNM